MRIRRKSPVNECVAHRLKEIRKSRGLASREVARLAGIPPGSYSCLENSRYQVKIASLLRILTALDVDIQDVWPAVAVPGDLLSDPEEIRRLLDELRAVSDSTEMDGGAANRGAR